MIYFKKFKSFCSFYNSFGQGGLLKFKLLKNLNYKLNFVTIWEDFTTVNFPKEINLFTENKNENDKLFEITDGNNLKKLKNNEKIISKEEIIIKALIPEYFSYEVIINGSIDYLIEKNIDSKIYGDILCKIIKENSYFKANKIKSENCEIETINGEIKINKYLEAFKTEVISNNGNIIIKKLGTSYSGKIISCLGNIKIDSIYSNYSKKSGLTFFLEENEKNFLKNFNELINFRNEIISEKGEILIKNSHGNLKINIKEGRISIENSECQSLFVIINKGIFELGIENICDESFIELGKDAKLILSLKKTLGFNICFSDSKKFFNDIYNVQKPTLIIKGNNIEINQDKIKIY